MPHPAVAIVIPAYNDEAWVATALESCINQSLSDIEIICVDDASTDGTRAIIESYVARDSRVRLIHQEVNGSAFQARRLGVEAAAAPYVLFLDGDDELAAETAQVALERAQSVGADVVAFGVDFVMPDGVGKPAFERELQPKHDELSGSEILPTLFPVGKPAHGHLWGYLFATELLRRAYADLPLDLHVPRANDLPISFLALAGASTYASIPERGYLYHFRRGASGQRVTNLEEFEFYLGAVDSIELIADKLRAHVAGREDADTVLACYESARLYMIGNGLRYSLGAADEDLQNACFVRMRERVSEIDIIRAAADFCTDALRLFPRSEATPAAGERAVRSVLITTAQLGTGGIQGVIASQAGYLIAAGIKVTIAVQRPADSVYDLPPGVNIIQIEGATMADRLRSWVDICRESDADLVLDHYVLYNRTWPFFVLAARTLGVSTIGFLQSYSLRPIRDDNANTSFLVQNLPLLAMVVTLSATDVAYWKLLGVERVVQLPHPPSPMLLERATRTGPKPAPAGPIRLVWWGRLQQSTKQIRDLIPITAALRARGVDVELTIIGPDTSDLTAARLMADAVAQGVSDIVNLPGPLHGQALIDALLEADVYVFTSVIEGSPLALIEAQSLGLPVVMYDLPWLANLDDNEGIVTVGQGDVRGFAREIQLLVEDPDRYVALSAGSLEAAQRATQLDFAALYTQLLTGDLPTAHSPEPTLSNARILLEWMVFYAELNARRHESQSKQIAALRARVTTLRKEASTARSKFLGQRRVTVELRQQLQEGRGALRIGRRAKRLVTRASRKAQSLLKGSASTQAVSRESVVILTEELTPQDRPVHTAGVGGQSVHATSEVAGAISGPDGISQSQPDVTVVIPIYNAGPWLDQCLSSVLSQSGVDLEVIGVNDGSTDDSRSILGRHAQQDSRVRIIDQANSGQSVGRNAGLDAATGRYVIFLDSDDFWAQDALSTLVRRADDDELDVLLLEGHSLRDGDVTEEVWDRYGSYYPRKHEYAEVRSGADMIVDMRRGRDYKAHVGLYLTRTSYAQAIGARFIPGIVHQDNPYTFALLLNAARVAHTKTDLYARRLRPGSTITTLQAVRSAKGYYLSYISMLRAVTSRDLPPEVANVLSNIVYEVFDSALDQFVQLPVSIGAELKKLDPSSDAQVAFRMLVSSRERVLAAARSDHSARHAQASAPEGIATATS